MRRRAPSNPASVPAHWLTTGRYRFNEDGDLEKRCSLCRDYFPPDATCFFASRNLPDGLHCWCKACWRERADERLRTA